MVGRSAELVELLQSLGFIAGTGVSGTYIRYVVLGGLCMAADILALCVGSASRAS